MTTVYNPVIQTYFKHIEPPSVSRGVRYAIAQGPSQVATSLTIKAAVEFNFATLDKACKLAANYRSQLISFPELFLSGYEFGDTEKSDEPVKIAKAAAEYIRDHKYLDVSGPLSVTARKYGLTIICPLPYAGKDPAGNDGIYDAAVIFSATGERLATQFKNHLWGIDERKWFRVPEYGPLDNPFATFLVNDFPVGVAICYDAEFPEVARSLSLNGALLTAMPTAAPDSMLTGQTEPYPDVAEHYIPANALQNQNFCSYGNRSGNEFRLLDGKEVVALKYSGNSTICSPYGKALVRAVRNEDALLIADCIICDFPSTQPADTDYIINRRPEIYSVMTDRRIPYPASRFYDYPKSVLQHQDPTRPQHNQNKCG